MIRAVTATAITAILASTVALAHANVENPAVMARMMAMTDIGAASRTLGQMARGRMDFDAAAAQVAAGLLAERAAEVPALFEAEEGDPQSEALPAIWQNFDDFTAKAKTLQTAAEALTSVATLEDLQAGMGAVGGTCRDCHGPYRK